MTPHIEAKKEDIKKTVLMPGDPLRAKYIADNFLTNVRLVNKVRNMFAYTGFYKDTEVTIMGSGIGMPSIGLYSYELYKFYDVENIIRIGTCGSYIKELNIFDVIVAKDAFSLSSFAKVQNGCDDSILSASEYINEKIIKTANTLDKKITESRIHSSDVFYKENNNYKEIVEKYNCVGVEMESFALFHNANILNKKAACILTVSDSFITKEETTSSDREKSLNEMITLALETAILL